MNLVAGQSIPKGGITAAVCLRWPWAIGLTTVRPSREVLCVALILGPVEVSVSVFWSKWL